MKVNWISVKDKLPDPYVSVFVYGKRIENISVVDRCDEKHICSKVVPFITQDFIIGDGGRWYFCDNITHWAEIEYPVPPANITRWMEIEYPDPPADDEL